MKSRIFLVSMLVVLGACSESVEWNAETVTEAAITDLARTLEALEDQIIVVNSAREITWSNGAMGCAQTGVNYSRNQVRGYQLLLGFVDQTYPYHQGGNQPPFHCAAPTE